MIRRLPGLQRCFVILMLALALVPLSASAQGNSGAAHACQGGGYMWLAGTSGETFGNVGQCVSYAAKGGTFAEGAIVVPAGYSVTFSNQVLSACNELTYGYALNGGSSGTLGGKPEGCATIGLGDVTIGPLTESAVLSLFLTDVTCGPTYSADGYHGRVTGSTPVYEVDIADGGPLCSIVGSPWPHASLGYDGNVSLTVTVHP